MGGQCDKISMLYNKHDTGNQPTAAVVGAEHNGWGSAW